MDKGLLIELLRQKQYLTDLEKDILDTWNELQKNPFNHTSAERQAKKNNEMYPDLYVKISALPSTVSMPWKQMTDQILFLPMATLDLAVIPLGIGQISLCRIPSAEAVFSNRVGKSRPLLAKRLVNAKPLSI